MSALRVPGPDGRIRLIDQGPATGRITHTRGATFGGVLVTPIAAKAAITQAQREAGNRAARDYWERNRDRKNSQQREKRAAEKAGIVKCGKVMPMVKDVCGRRAGHAPTCRSSVVMAEEALKRRTFHPLGGQA